MYQFLGRDTLALWCGAQESLFIRKVFRKRDFLWCEINFTNPRWSCRESYCDHFNHSKLLFCHGRSPPYKKTNMQQSTSISAAQFASKALAYSITLFFPDYPIFFADTRQRLASKSLPEVDP